jgi:hypothetical protein
MIADLQEPPPMGSPKQIFGSRLFDDIVSGFSEEELNDLLSPPANRAERRTGRRPTFRAYPSRGFLPPCLDPLSCAYPNRAFLFRYLAPETLIHGIDSKKARLFLWAAVYDQIHRKGAPVQQPKTFADQIVSLFSTHRTSETDYITRCLSADPAKRPSPDDVLSFFRSRKLNQRVHRAPAPPPIFPLRHQFCDLVIDIPNASPVHCHRMMTTHFSGWFHDLFLDNPYETRISLADKPHKEFVNVLEFFYTGNITISDDSIVSTVLVAYFYDIASLKPIVDQRLFQYIEEVESDASILLQLLRELCEAGLVYHALALTPKVAESHILQTPRLRAILFSVITPEVLAELFQQQPLLSLMEDDKLGFAEAYAKSRSITFTEQQRKLLTDRILQWDRTDVPIPFFRHQKLVGRDLDWVLPSVTRRHYELALAIRCANIASMLSATDRAPRRVSRWFIAAWLSAIYSAESIDSSPIVSAVHLTRTVGSAKVDPVAFGFVHVCSSRPIAPSFAPKHCLLSKKARAQRPTAYFVSETEGREVPWISIDFGPEAQFTVKNVRLDFDPADRNRSRPLQGKLDVLGETAAGFKFRIASRVGDEKDYVLGGRGMRFDVEMCQRTCRKVIVRQSDPSQYGVHLLRICHFELRGVFAAGCPARQKNVRVIDVRESD